MTTRSRQTQHALDLLFSRPGAILLGVSAALLGCGAIPIKLHTETHIQHADGRVEHESSDWRSIKASAASISSRSRASPTVSRSRSSTSASACLPMTISSRSRRRSTPSCVVSAPSSLTNPKVVMHLDLVKKGLLSSVDVVRSLSGALLEFGKDLSPFG